MKLLGRGTVFAFLVATGCGHLPEARQGSMVRSFHGTLVPGYYVSPTAYQHYIQAQLLSNEGRAEEAADELRHALASDGASAYLHARLSEELLSLGRVDEAREEVEAALRLDPRFPEAYVDQAKVKLRVGDSAGAEHALKRALEIDRTCEDAYLGLVGLYREHGQNAAAAGRVDQVWREMARWVPGSAQAHESLGRALQASGDVRGAEKELQQAIELDSGTIDARVAYAELLQGEGRFAEAAARLREAWDRSGDLKLVDMIVRLEMASGREAAARDLIDRLDDEGGNHEHRLEVARLHLIAHSPERALAIAEQILRAADSPRARILAAQAYEVEGRIDEALQQLRKVPRESNQFARAQEQLGRLLRDVGRYREAIELIGSALAIVVDGEARDSLSDLLALTHERAGDRAQAIQVLEQGLTERPRSTALTFSLAQAYVRDGQWDRAIALGEKVLKRAPESAQALNFVGYLLADRGVRLTEAKTLLERALRLHPSDGAVIDSLGWLYCKLGRLDEAEHLLVRADRLTPDDPEILGHLGSLYVRKADRVRALETYKRALAHHPDERLRRTVEEQILLLENGRLAGSR
jgi:tetratricopeptide (TPR) repeat protein